MTPQPLTPEAVQHFAQQMERTREIYLQISTVLRSDRAATLISEIERLYREIQPCPHRR